MFIRKRKSEIIQEALGREAKSVWVFKMGRQRSRVVAGEQKTCCKDRDGVNAEHWGSCWTAIPDVSFHAWTLAWKKYESHWCEALDKSLPINWMNAVKGELRNKFLCFSKAWHKLGTHWQPCKSNCMVPIQWDSQATAPSRGEPTCQ